MVLIIGSDRGIGAPTTKLLERLGYKVCINYKTDGVSAEKRLAQLSGYAVKCIAVQADVAVEADVLALFQRIDSELGTITNHFLCSREAVKRMSFKYCGNGGIDTFTRGVSLEVAQQGIRVNFVRPGFIYTDMHGDGGELDWVNRIKNQIPMGRGGEPEEMAQAIYWLLTDALSYSSGTFIDVCGGC